MEDISSPESLQYDLGTVEVATNYFSYSNKLGQVGFGAVYKVDVFSFSIVLWEILTGEEPYANMHYGAIIGGIVNNTLRPATPSSCDPEWKKLMEQCWAPNPIHG